MTCHGVQVPVPLCYCGSNVAWSTAGVGAHTGLLWTFTFVLRGTVLRVAWSLEVSGPGGGRGGGAGAGLGGLFRFVRGVRGGGGGGRGGGGGGGGGG